MSKFDGALALQGLGDHFSCVDNEHALLLRRLDLAVDVLDQVVQRLLDELADFDVHLPVDLHYRPNLLHFDFFDLGHWLLEHHFDATYDLPDLVVIDFTDDFVIQFVELGLVPEQLLVIGRRRLGVTVRVFWMQLVVDEPFDETLRDLGHKAAIDRG